MVTALKATDLVSPSPFSLRVDTASLRRVTATLARIADHRSTMPMLAHVRIHTTPAGGVVMSATDLNLSVTVTDPAWRSDGGSVCVPAKQLAEIVKSAGAADVTLSASGSQGLRVVSGDAEMTLIGLPSRDFPKLPEPCMLDPHVWQSTDGDVLVRLFETALPSVCKDETRFHLNGVLIECNGSVTRMVSTDGHRLTRCEGWAPGPRIAGAILPAKAAKEIARLIKAVDRTVSWAVTATHLYVRCGGWDIVAKLIDAQFPPYEQVIPKDHDKCASVERKPLVAALKRAKKLYRDDRGVKLAFASGKLTLTSDHPDTGTSVETLSARSQWLDDGGTFTIGANPGYLLDAIDGMDDRYVTIDMGGELDPVLVRTTTEAVERSVATSTHVVVVMPMRI